VREGIWKGIGTDIIYAREDLWKNRKECRTRVSYSVKQLGCGH